MRLILLHQKLVHAGEHGTQFDLLADLHVEVGEHTVGRCGDGVLHLHRLHPHHRLSGGDGVAHCAPIRLIDPGIGASNEPGCSAVPGSGKRGPTVSATGAQRRVDVNGVAVAADAERPVDAVDREHHLRRGADTSATSSSPGSLSPSRSNRYSHAVFVAGGVAVSS